MDLIYDNNGVDIIIAPVTGRDGLQLNIDFNFTARQLDQMNNHSRDWDLKLMDGRRHIGTATFSAYQFMVEGLDRRTIALKNLSLEPRARNQGKSYDLMKFVLDTVTRECDNNWGKVYGEPVVFIEKRLLDAPQNERNGLFDFLKKIAEKIIGKGSSKQPTGTDLAVSVIGDNVSIQLIHEHLIRSAKAENRNPR